MRTKKPRLPRSQCHTKGGRLAATRTCMPPHDAVHGLTWRSAASLTSPSFCLALICIVRTRDMRGLSPFVPSVAALLSLPKAGIACGGIGGRKSGFLVVKALKALLDSLLQAQTVTA